MKLRRGLWVASLGQAVGLVDNSRNPEVKKMVANLTQNAKRMVRIDQRKAKEKDSATRKH